MMRPEPTPWPIVMRMKSSLESPEAYSASAEMFASLPTAVGSSAAASMMVLITTEFVGAKAGLGYLIISAQNNFQIPEMYAGILTISVIGVGFNYLLLLLERRFSRWRP